MKNLIKKRILIIGSNGMLGQRLAGYYKLNEKVELLCSSIEDKSFVPNVEYKMCDITNKNNIKNLLTDFYPDVIINAAAYTNVDGCEREKELAWKLNVTAVDNLSRFARIVHAHLIHFSTDYIFDGDDGPYDELNIPDPISYYGRTKLASENFVSSSSEKHTIFRINVLYGPAKYGKSDFVRWVVTSLKNTQEINIVTDQINNPTYTDDLVQAVNNSIYLKKYGVFNIAGLEIISRYNFTLRIADFFNLDKNLINRIKTSDLNQLAKRPLFSGLIINKAIEELGYSPHTIEETFQLMKNELRL